MSATNRGGKRRAHDFYPTPAHVVDLILCELEMSRVATFCEPCRGDGAIYNRVDVEQKYFAEIREGLDYLKTPLPHVDLIVTNPPFSLAQEFLDKSFREADTVVYLCRLALLESRKRRNWWQGREPSHLFVLSERPSFTGNGTDATAYGWFAWDGGGLCRRRPGIHII